MEEKELKLKAIEVAKDITVAFIQKEIIHPDKVPQNTFLTQYTGEFLEEMYYIAKRILEEG